MSECTLHVNGKGIINLFPKIALINFNLITTDNLASKAIEKIDKKKQELQKLCEEIKIDNKDIELHNTNIEIRGESFTARKHICLKFRDFSTAEFCQEKLKEYGFGAKMEFSEDEERSIQRARVKSSEDARKKAMTYCKAMKMKIVSIKRFEEEKVEIIRKKVYVTTNVDFIIAPLKGNG